MLRLGVRGAQEQVHARANRGDDLDRLRRTLRQGAHVKGIADGHALEPELGAEDAGHDGARQGRWRHGAVRERRGGDVGRHDESGAGVDAGPERHQLHGRHPLARAADHRHAVMRVDGRLAQAREVLDPRRHARSLQATDHRRPQSPDLGRVIPERADPERRVDRVGRDVHDRGIDDVDTHGPCLAPDRLAHPFREVRIADGAQRHVPSERRRAVTEGQELAALLVGGDEHRGGRGSRSGRDPAGRRHPRSLERLGQLAQLPRRPHVEVPEHRHARRRRLGQPLRDPRRAVTPRRTRASPARGSARSVTP